MLLQLNLNVVTNIILVIKCHDEHESHSIQRWTEKEFDKKLLCVVCATMK